MFFFAILSSIGHSKISVRSLDDDYEADIEATTGDSFLESSPNIIPVIQNNNNNNRLTASFKNGYFNESITLYWLSDQGEEVCMGDIPPDSDTIIDTFTSHTFLARTTESHQRAHPPQAIMQLHQRSYVFGPRPESVSERQDKLFFQVLNHRTTATSAKFRCLVPQGVDIYYEDGRGGLSQGSLGIGQEYTVNTYEGHVFFFTLKGNKEKELARFTMDSKKVLYLIQDPAHPPAKHFLDHRDKEEAFMKEYEARTGRQWRHYFGPEGPRGPPIHFMWPAEHKGQIHNVTSTEGFWHCRGSKEECQSTEPVELSLKVVSTAPKAFVIPHFISDYEVESILGLARPRVADSYVGSMDGGGARLSDTRTSKNTWLPRVSNEVIETLFKRAEHLLKIPKIDATNCEDLQVVNYKNGQKYDNHHDWGVSGYPESRYLTLLLYLNDMASRTAGGETAFPKAEGGLGFKVHPGKGSAVLFYDLLEDGNGDDLSLHAALPVYEGEKWVANFWVWDPKRK
eukprot:scaffold1160_cov174-Ochromonas_danica.AAC.23